jgi:hypothetical protein
VPIEDGLRVAILLGSREKEVLDGDKIVLQRFRLVFGLLQELETS